ncbi:MAG: class I SAM-dependent methyltransferase [Rhodocyclaceae bacterium]|nr:class I SAM-dependent methyltransferase [Rhodocyclaceae bacterium]
MPERDLDDFLDAYGDGFAHAFDNRIIQAWYPERIIRACDADSRSLELGVGHGRSTARLARHFREHVVVEGSPAIIRQFARDHPHSGAIVEQALFERYRPDAPFDVIVCGFVLEHVDDPVALLRRCRDWLTARGRCFVAVPNGESLHRRVGHAAGLLADPLALGPGDHALGHRRQYSVARLDRELAAAGFRVVRREGVFMKALTTAQLRSLELDEAVLRALCEVAVDYPELSCALLFEAIPERGAREGPGVEPDGGRR